MNRYEINTLYKVDSIVYIFNNMHIVMCRVNAIKVFISNEIHYNYIISPIDAKVPLGKIEVNEEDITDSIENIIKLIPII